MCNNSKRVILAVLTVTAVAATFYALYKSHTGLRTWRDATLKYKPGMDHDFGGYRVNDILPEAWPEGKLYWLNTKTLSHLEGHETLPDYLYVVRIDPCMSPLLVNGVTQARIVGFVACPGPDDEVNYVQDERNVSEYDVTNGVKSGGDIIHVFYK